jgi:excisionase family DNA binding protein
MLPSFEIYLSIMTDNLMPWLKENRRQEKFEAVIRNAGPGFCEEYRIFFTSVGCSFKKFHPVSTEKIIQELEHLSNVSATPLGKEMAKVFCTSPVQNYREHFYNAITRMCLGAYHDCLDLFFRKCEGPETKAFYLEKLLTGIHSMLLITLPEEFENPEEEKIVVRVKLALAILYRLLQKKQGKIENSMLLYFDVRGWLKECLGKLEEEGCAEEMQMIFDLLTREKRTVEPGKLTVASEIEPDMMEMETTGSYSEILNAFKSFHQDFNEVKQNVIHILQNEPTVEKTGKPVEKWLTSPEVCNMMRISKSTLQRWRKSKKIKFFKLAGKYRYLEQDILNLMRANDSNLLTQAEEPEIKVEI